LGQGDVLVRDGELVEEQVVDRIDEGHSSSLLRAYRGVCPGCLRRAEVASNRHAVVDAPAGARVPVRSLEVACPGTIRSPHLAAGRRAPCSRRPGRAPPTSGGRWVWEERG